MPEIGAEARPGEHRDQLAAQQVGERVQRFVCDRRSGQKRVG